VCVCEKPGGGCSSYILTLLTYLLTHSFTSLRFLTIERVRIITNTHTHTGQGKKGIGGSIDCVWTTEGRKELVHLCVTPTKIPT
jgi:hypothetical protein